MAATDGVPPMRTVHADDVPADMGPLASPRKAVPRLIAYALVVAVGFVVTTVWHVSNVWLVVVVGAVALVAVTVEVVRAVRRRRAGR